MWESLDLSIGDIHNPGPGFVPFFLGLSLVTLTFLSFLAPDLNIKGDAFWNNWKEGRNILYIFAGLIVYLVLFNPLGFYLDTALLLIYLMKLAGEKRMKKNVLVCGVAIITIYLLFSKLLIIPFPRGFLGI